MVTEVNDFSAIKKGNVIVDFYTSSCGPCKAMNPILEEISKEYDHITVAKVNVANNPDMTQMFGIMSVPTVIFLKDSQVRHVSHGFSNKESFRGLVRKYCCA